MERDPVAARGVAPPGVVPPGVAPGWRLGAFVLVLVVGGFLIGFFWRTAGLPRRLLGESAQPLAMFAMSVLLVG